MQRPAYLILLLISVAALVTGGNIESSADGTSFCISKPPKRSILSNCTSSEMCEYLLGVSPSQSPSPSIVQCGDEGECVSNLSPENEYCKEACESSDCASLCLQLHETKTGIYCIQTRDHPNAMPSSISGGVSANKYYCTCILPPNDNFHHKIVSRRLK